MVKQAEAPVSIMQEKGSVIRLLSAMLEGKDMMPVSMIALGGGVDMLDAGAEGAEIAIMPYWSTS